MSTFNPALKAPGVYILEEDVPGPIPGVSTGIAAIVGPALSGPINTPVFVTNWTQFTETFGGYSYDPPIFATHAVRGFFENGGSICCFVRVGRARRASLDIPDRSGNSNPVFTLTSLTEGVKGNSISAALSDAPLCETDAVIAVANSDDLSADKLKLTMASDADAKLFTAGDLICLSQGSLIEEAEVAMVTGKTIVLKTELESRFTSSATAPIAIRLADPKGKKRLRLLSIDKLEAGSYLQITQEVAGSAIIEYALVDSFDDKAVLLRSPLKEEFSLASGSEAIKVRSMEFTMEITQSGKKEKYKELSTVPYHSRYYEKAFKAAKSALVEISPADPPNPNSAPGNLPDLSFTGSLSGGVDESLGELKPNDYTSAIDALEKVSVNIVCVPDAVKFGPGDENNVPSALTEHCMRMKDRFAVLDCAYNLTCQGAIKQRENCFIASTYAAAYYPWIEIPHPQGLGRLKVPPSGHIAGVYARTDDAKGVHKAPGNEIIMGCLGPDIQINDTEHGMLNESGVNAIINIPGNGPTIMGARTLSNKSETQWRYINIRRLLLYIEKSIQEATRFAVFLPNNPSLWATVKRQVTDFLTGVWRSGALFGAAPADSFKVKVDEELNPPSVRALGQLIIEVVLYPVTPAEFIVFRVIQQPGGPSVSE